MSDTVSLPETASGVQHASTRRSFVHGTLMATVLLATRMGCQAAVLVGIARVMQAEGYGQFAAMVALASLFAPLAGLGTDFVAMRTVAQRPEAALAAFRAALRVTLVSSLPLMLLAGAIAGLAFGDSVPAVLIVAVLLADILTQRICELVAKIFQGRELILQMGLVRLFPALFRLLAVIVFLLLPSAHTPGGWSILYALGSVGAAALAVRWLSAEQHGRDAALADERLSWRDGLHFAGGVMSARLHTEADKSLVLSLSGASGAGVYAAAYRVVEFLLIPIVAVVSVAYGRLFSAEHRGGTRAAAATGLRFTLLGLLLACVIAVCIRTMLAPLMSWAVGPSFAAVEHGIAALTLLPMAMSLRLTGEQNLAAIARLRVRSLIQWSAAAAGLTANLVLIPQAGWVGAVWVCVVVEAALGIAYLTVLLTTRHAPLPAAQAGT